MNYEAFDRDGKPITNGNLPDGGRIRVTAMLMDAAPSPLQAMHRPGFVQLSDEHAEARETALADRDRRLSEAWKQPAPIQAPPAAKIAPTTPAAGADAGHAARIHRLENAWRS
ncbi:hypothetical protein IVB45_01475 [Bradyrhizobium sp. 4]|uniref:hypothetical protein n=1 Tax=unclassified Bradyrhizobium TaxID=2631580 RepID=UPI001FF71844|nr:MULTISPECIES: hypothetical protein [unclassified Bradyrhizobium]MCK1403594.1 hypothetical protein [Bradyrhizobium sp. 39]MCK1746789.1 hypothetical protein [Bradyrhizobium sp. 135]UPJ35711.1 hypothetical protein IVB45_01475 [Bradyrhizobium sp. 4]